MSGLSELLKHRFEGESWDAIAQMAMGFQIELSREDPQTAKIRKELAMIKHILHENMKSPDSAQKFANAAFFVRMYKTLQRLEKEFDKHGLERAEFLMFLEAVLHKIRNERLIVQKPLERKNEFKRLKDVDLK